MSLQPKLIHQGSVIQKYAQYSSNKKQNGYRNKMTAFYQTAASPVKARKTTAYYS